MLVKKVKDMHLTGTFYNIKNSKLVYNTYTNNHITFRIDNIISMVNVYLRLNS